MKNNSKENKDSPASVDLIDEAIFLMRRGGAKAMLYYALGTTPFILNMLYFWVDGSNGWQSTGNKISSALSLCTSFSWMKAWQSIYCQYLHNLKINASFNLSLNIFWKTLHTQSIHHAWALLLLPLSFAVSCVVAVPFAWAYAYYQNITVLGYCTPKAPSIGQQAYAQALLWPKQNHLIIWLTSPWLLGLALGFGLAMGMLITNVFSSEFSLLIGLGEIPRIMIAALVLMAIWPLSPIASLVAANIAITIFLLPHLLHMLFGIETTFVRDGVFGIINSSTLLLVFSLTYFIMDPIVKSLYTLRCFYGQSIKSGQDLLSELSPYLKRSLNKISIILISVMLPYLFSNQVFAQTDQVPVQENIDTNTLHDAIEKTMSQRKYTWRLPPKEGPDSPEADSWLDLSWLSEIMDDLWDSTKGIVKDIAKWINDFLKNNAPEQKPTSSSDIDWAGAMNTIAKVLIFITGLILVALAIKAYTNRQKYKAKKVDTTPVVIPDIDLKSETLSAKDLPEAEWLKLSNDMLSKGEYRFSLRALYLGTLSFLDRQALLAIMPHKSNMDYYKEVNRRRRSWTTLPQAFGQHIHTFEESWYGTEPVSREDIENYLGKLNEIKGLFHEQ